MTRGDCMKNNSTRLYNVIFPLWMMFIFPQTWLIVGPTNFAIDFAVVYFTMKKLDIEQPKEKTKKAIIKVWLCGFAADIAGGALMFMSSMASNRWWFDHIGRYVYNPFESIYALVWTCACVAVSAVVIYYLNKCWCLKGLNLEESHIKKIAMALAVITAPYLFLLPTSWFY